MPTTSIYFDDISSQLNSHSALTQTMNLLGMLLLPDLPNAILAYHKDAPVLPGHKNRLEQKAHWRTRTSTAQNRLYLAVLLIGLTR
jgi:hypothetical protein